MEQCSEYNWDKFFYITHVILPSILRKAHRNGIPFLVKGGKAIDMYMKRKAGSVDWDIITPDVKGLANFIEDRIKSHLTDNLISENLVFELKDTYDVTNNYRGKQIGVNICGGLYFVDILEIPYDQDDIVVMDGIPFLKYDKLYNDLLKTYEDRKQKIDEIKSNNEISYEFEDNYKKFMSNLYVSVEDNLETFDVKLEDLDPSSEKGEAENILRLLRKKIDGLKNNFIEDIKNFKKIYKKALEKNTADVNEITNDDLEDLVGSINNLHDPKYLCENINQMKIGSEKSSGKEKLQKTLVRIQMLKNALENGDNLSKEFIKYICEECSNNLEYLHSRFPGTKISCKFCKQNEK